MKGKSTERLEEARRHVLMTLREELLELETLPSCDNIRALEEPDPNAEWAVCHCAGCTAISTLYAAEETLEDVAN